MKHCKHCNKEFIPPRLGAERSYCSRECYLEDIKPPVNKCLNCGAETKTKFCCRSCSASYNNKLKPKRQASYKYTCETCGTPTNNKHWCSQLCRPKVSYEQYRARMNEANARYMSRRKFQTPADEDIKSLQEFYANCPEGFEVDHIIPVSKGGLHTLSNLQYLTKLENRRKSNKMMATEVGVEPTPSVLETDVLP